MKSAGLNLSSDGVMNMRIDPAKKSFMLYMKALSLKRLGEHKNATKCYIQLIKRNKTQENLDLWLTMFSVIILPETKDRRLICSSLEKIVDFFHTYGDRDKKENHLMKSYSVKSDTWYPNMEEQIVKELKERSFFRRFTREELVKMMPQLRIR